MVRIFLLSFFVTILFLPSKILLAENLSPHVYVATATDLDSCSEEEKSLDSKIINTIHEICEDNGFELHTGTTHPHNNHGQIHYRIKCDAEGKPIGFAWCARTYYSQISGTRWATYNLDFVPCYETVSNTKLKEYFLAAFPVGGYNPRYKPQEGQETPTMEKPFGFRD